MPLRIESVPKEQKVTFLEDVDCNFVSLVDKGANWWPFQIIKSDKGGINMAGQVIQSIILPNDMTLDDLKKEPGCEWLASATAEKMQKFDAVTSYTQIAKNEFKEDSKFSSLKLGKTGAFAVVGELKKSEHSKQDAIIEIPVNVLDSVIPDGYGPTVGDVIYWELDKFVSVMWAALGQQSAKPANRKTTVMNALSAFWDFLNGTLDKIGAGPVKSEKREAAGALIAEPIKKTETVKISPSEGESQDDFMARCVPAMVDEGKDEEQAVAMCMNMFTQKRDTQPAKAENQSEGEIVMDEKLKAEITELVGAAIAKAAEESAKGMTEAITKAVAEAVPSVVKTETEKFAETFKAEQKAAAEKAAEAKEKTAEEKEAEFQKSVNDLTGELQKVVETVSALREKAESLEHAVVGAPPVNDTVVTGKTKMANPTPFTGAGLFS